jgi:nitrogen regulatory protein PII
LSLECTSNAASAARSVGSASRGPALVEERTSHRSRAGRCPPFEQCLRSDHVGAATPARHAQCSYDDHREERTPMKCIVAIIKPYQLDNVKEHLTEAGVQGLTVAEVRGFGRQRGKTELYRGAEYVVDFVPKVQLTVLADDDRVASIVDAILEGAHTGKIGDGKIFVMPVEEVVRIRTGERGRFAI